MTAPLHVSPEDRCLLAQWLRSPTKPQRVVRRSRIVLLAADDLADDEIAALVAVSPPTVKLWIRRFVEGGPAALLHDAPGRGRRASLDPSTVIDRLRAADLLGADGEPVSLRRASAFLGVSASTVWRALRAAHPQPRRS